MEYLPKVINSCGLLFDILGALLIWKYGLPEEITKAGHRYLTFGTDEEEQKKAIKFERYAKLGIILLISGFGFQLASNWVH